MTKDLNSNQLRILNLLESINYKDYYKPESATHDQIELFKKRALKKQVEQTVIDQLVDLYEVANNYDILGLYGCDDLIIFEWWNYQELWIGQRDFYTLRWANGKFCLGDAGDISFSEEYEFYTLIELIKACIKEMLLDNFDH